MDKNSKQKYLLPFLRILELDLPSNSPAADTSVMAIPLFFPSLLSLFSLRGRRRVLLYYLRGLVGEAGSNINKRRRTLFNIALSVALQIQRRMPELKQGLLRRWH